MSGTDRDLAHGAGTGGGAALDGDEAPGRAARAGGRYAAVVDDAPGPGDAGGPGGAGAEAGEVGELDSGDEVLTGRRVGRYRVGPVVHSGPMSTLYRADDVRLDRPVALKVISPLLAAEEEFRARFVEEARSLSAVDHPHVVPLYDHDEDPDGHLWLAMRWVDGTTLAQAVAGTPMLLARCLALFDQVAAALDAVHACGLVHLDVKPANILLTADPGRPAGAGGSGPAGRAGWAERPEHVYLADFGLTRRGRSGGRTAAGEFVGSPAFASPEHLRGEPVGVGTDIYGLACSLTVALTGRPPYLGTVDEVIAAHLAGERRPASRVRGEVVPGLEPGFALGPAVDAELAWALSPDPADRPASAGELMAAVGAAMRQDACRVAPGPAPDRASERASERGSGGGPTVGPGGGSPVRARPPAPSPRPGPAPGPSVGPRPPVPVPEGVSVPAGVSVHAGAPPRRVRPAVAPLTEDLFTTSRSRAPVAPRDPRVVLAVAAVLSLLVLVLATVLA